MELYEGAAVPELAIDVAETQIGSAAWESRRRGLRADKRQHDDAGRLSGAGVPFRSYQ